MNRKKASALLLVIVFLFSLAGCGNEIKEEESRDKIYGLLSLSAIDKKEAEDLLALAEESPVKEIKTFSSTLEAMKALEEGEVEGIAALPLTTAKYLANQNEDLEAAYFGGPSMYFRMGVREEDQALQEELNGAIRRLVANKDIEDLIVKDLLDCIDQTPKENLLPNIPGAKTLKAGVTGDFPPLDYLTEEGKAAGFSQALLAAVSKEIGKNIEILTIDVNRGEEALKNGDIDLLFWTLTLGDEEEKEGLLITDPYFIDKMVLLKRTEKK